MEKCYFTKSNAFPLVLLTFLNCTNDIKCRKVSPIYTVQKVKVSIMDFFSKCDQISSFQGIERH